MRDSKEYAAAIDQLQTALALLTQEVDYERQAWREAYETQVTEFRHLVKRQDETQDQQLAIAGGAFELNEHVRREIGELVEQTRFAQAQFERILQRQDENSSSMDKLEGEMRDLSLLTYEIYDDLAQRVDSHEHRLLQLETTLNQRHDEWQQSLASAQEFLTEGLVEATEAANQHADAIIELKDAVNVTLASNDALQESMSKRQEDLQNNLLATAESLRDRIDSLTSNVTERTFVQEQQHVEATKSQQKLQNGLEELRHETLRQQQANGELLNQQAGRQDTFHAWLQQLQAGVREEIEQLQSTLSVLASQGETIVVALDSVQQGAISAEQATASWLQGQLEAFRALQEALQERIDQSHAAAQSLHLQAQQQVKTLESKTVQALTHQHHEKLEHDRQLAAMRDEYSQLSNRVGSILQLLMNSNRLPSTPGQPTWSS